MTRQLTQVGSATWEEDRAQPFEEEAAAEAVDPLLFPLDQATSRTRVTESA
jgi:hypothetical protein